MALLDSFLMSSIHCYQSGRLLRLQHITLIITIIIYFKKLQFLAGFFLGAEFYELAEMTGGDGRLKQSFQRCKTVEIGDDICDIDDAIHHHPPYINGVYKSFEAHR